jgi:hypothetical protein
MLGCMSTLMVLVVKRHCWYRKVECPSLPPPVILSVERRIANISYGILVNRIQCVIDGILVDRIQCVIGCVTSQIGFMYLTWQSAILRRLPHLHF